MEWRTCWSIKTECVKASNYFSTGQKRPTVYYRYLQYTTDTYSVLQTYSILETYSVLQRLTVYHRELQYTTENKSKQQRNTKKNKDFI